MATDEATIEEGDADIHLGFQIAVDLVSQWMADACYELADPELPNRTVEWVRTTLGEGPGDRASRAVDLVDEATPAQTVAEVLDDLDLAFLPATIWLLAGVLAVYRGGLGWLEELYAEEGT